jgi:predicted ArsR family transcriptional regulator
VARIPVVRKPFTPTPRALEVLAARCATGSRQDAASALGISLNAVVKHLTILRVGSGAADDAQLCWLYREAIAPHVGDPE